MEDESPASSFATVTPSVWKKYHGGDQATWEKVSKKYRESLQRFLRSYLRSREVDAIDDQLIDDVITDALMKVRNSRKFTIQFQGGGFNSYLRDTARTVLIDTFFRSKQNKKEFLTYTSDYEKDAVTVASYRQESMSDIGIEELREQIRECAQKLQEMGKVSEEHMKIFFEAWNKDLSPTEIARRYCTSSANVNQIKCRVTKMIRERLGTKHE